MYTYLTFVNCKVISLEVSDAHLSDDIQRPKVVRDLDWYDRFWPEIEKDEQLVYPKVQVYCLMSPANCFTEYPF
jgi:F-box/leucine-rich repeat protein 10/11